jgi:hypothetical protein
MMEFVALRDILPGEEIVIDFGREWEDAWKIHNENDSEQEFRHEIGVPDDFSPPSVEEPASCLRISHTRVATRAWRSIADGVGSQRQARL